MSCARPACRCERRRTARQGKRPCSMCWLTITSRNERWAGLIPTSSGSADGIGIAILSIANVLPPYQVGVDHSYPQFYTWSECEWYVIRSGQEGDVMTAISDLLGKIPDSLMDKSGTVFNSGRQTFESPSALYILGANPGGSPTSYTRYNNTVQGNVEDAIHNWSENYSPYRDQRWGGYRPGRHPMQRGLLHLFSRVNKRPEEVPGSEVVLHTLQESA